MRKRLCIICVLTMVIPVLVATAGTGTITKIKTKTLSIAGDVTFTSGFKAADGDTITISILDIVPNDPTDPTVTISGVSLDKVTPKPKQGGGSIDVLITGDRDVEVTLHNSRLGKSTFHLWLHLSTGEHLGVNVNFGR